MTNDEAKKILALFRPGTADRTDPSFSQALEKAKSNAPTDRWQPKSDSDLPQWFHAHCASQLSVRTKFARIPIPVGLRDKILAGHTTNESASKIIWPLFFLRAAAIMVLFLGLAAVWWQSHGPVTEAFNTYRTRMARTALQSYGMDLQSHDLRAINSYLASRKAPASYVLPKGVLHAQPVGCAVLQWQGAQVSMLCFHSGKSLSGSEQSDLWLFVIPQPAVRDGSPAAQPALARVKELMTASWTRDGTVYVLAAAGDESFLRRYL